MTSLSRIARLAQIPEIRKKKRDNDPQKRKKDDNDKSDKEERPAFPLKGNFTVYKPRTNVRTQTTSSKKPPRSLEKGIGERLDLKV